MELHTKHRQPHLTRGALAGGSRQGVRAWGRFGRTVALPAALTLAGCAVVEPPGWPAERRPTASRRVVATPGVMYGYAPLSWDLPDGQTVVIDVARLALPPGAVEVEFTASFAATPGHGVRCSTSESAPPAGWFRCEGRDEEGREISFQLGEGQACALSVGSRTTTLSTPACWRGDARVGGRAFVLERGYLARSRLAVGHVSWNDAHGPRLVANLVGELQIQLYDGPRELDAADDDLLLLTIAAHWFAHATSS